MGIYRREVLPRFIDKALGTADVRHWRERAVDGLEGHVVEPGFGSGLNLPVYPHAVTRVSAIDPAEVGRRLAADRLAATHVEVDFVGLDGQAIPLADNTCDAGLLTFTLCTIPDAQVALAELHRVIKPGGRLHVLEHGHAPEPNVATWQRRIEPAQRRLFDGCHLTRNMTELISGAQFDIEWVEETYSKGPKPWSFFYLGQAVAA